MKEYKNLQIRIVMMNVDVVTASGEDSDGMFESDIFTAN